MKKNTVLILLISAAVLVLILIPSAIKLSTDWMWFSSEGYTQLFSTVILSKLLLGIGAGLLTLVVIYLNIWIAQRLTRNQPPLLQLGRLNITGERLFSLIKKMAFPVSFMISLLTGFAASTSWLKVQQFLNGTMFGTQDPIFHRDISFYIFTLPVIQFAIGLLFWIIIASGISSIIIYITRGVFMIRNKKIESSKNARNHLMVLGALFFLLIAARTFYISMPNILFSTIGPFTGASYTDVNAVLPVLWIQLVAALLVVMVLLISLFGKYQKLVIGSIALYIFIGLVLIPIYPSIVHKLVVLPNEIAKETEFIEYNIEATRVAYGLDGVEKRDLTTDVQLTADDIANNELTIKNVRLWDRRPLLDSFGQIQEIRTYYDFVSVDNDRYMIDNEYRQTMLSPRELNTLSLPSSTFINDRLAFTHGYGVALGPVNEVTEEGLPLLFVKNIPPESSVESLDITRPEIYFGELSSDYVFVNTDAEEFDYPKGDENVYGNYEGEGGVVIDSFLKKLLFAGRFGSLKILLSNDINSDSRVLFHRNILDRTMEMLPFLKTDSDPYMVITEDGELKWMYDAYTSSDMYPYSERVAGISETASTAYTTETPAWARINYIRNSVKIVIDAYDGHMDFYVADDTDPLIKTYEKIFPDTFKPLGDMPADLRVHIRYPEDIFKLQTYLYTTYHMEQANVFYNKEDSWQVPQTGEDKSDPMMRHMIMKLPGEEKEEFILMLPYTPANKDNLAAWMVARSDGEHYGELLVYRFPKQKLVFGPKQIVNRINQDPEISRQISLWDQRGSQVNQGNLLVIPIEESLLYVRPLYIRAEGGKIPELKRVIVAYESSIAMDKTLSGALDSIFSGTKSVSDETEEAADVPDVATTPDNENLIQQAQDHYNKALDAQKKGDWTTYGNEIRALGDTLKTLDQ